MGWIADLLSEIPSAARYKIQLEQLVAEHSSLEEKNAICKSELGNARKEIQRLNLVIDGFENKDKEQYNHITNKILKLFFDVARDISVNEIASKLAMDISTAQYHLDLLSNKNLIRYSSKIPVSLKVRSGTSRTLEITPQGRKYVIEQMNK
jgi:DNA-binding MarR family transcriptional regulator